MNSFETIVAAERRKGWFPHLCATPSGWTCRLECGVEVLRAEQPRPIGEGPTAEAALTDAVRKRALAGIAA